MLSVAMIVLLTACGKKDVGFKITSVKLTNEPIGVCIKKGDIALKTKIDEAIVTLQENGTMKSLSEEWLLGDYVSNIEEEIVGFEEAQGQSDNNDAVEIVDINDMSVLRVGLNDTYAPMEYRNEDVELVGFDVDFAKELAKELGVKVEFTSIAWEGIFAGLNSNKYDVIISGTSITPQRLQNFEFSIPYVANGQVIVVQEGNDSIKTIEDLAGKKVGVQLETTADTAATKRLETVTEENKFEIIRYDDIISTFSDLKLGRLDAIIVDNAVAVNYTTNNK
jgi:ABC-type amino acid transport substrate-binding protein